MNVRLIVFDKDGTLISWSVWDAAIGAVLDEFVDAARRADAAEALEYDLARREVFAGSPVIAGSNADVIDLLFPFAAAHDRQSFHRLVETRFAELTHGHVAERPGATDLLERAQAAGVAVALCTNDSTAGARAQVAQLGWTELIPYVYGYDAGHGAKPGPGMLLAALAAVGCEPSEAVMVGDSGADLLAASGAGMPSVYLGEDPRWCAHADHALNVLDDVGALLFGSE